MQWKMEPVKNEFQVDFLVNLQEDFASAVARADGLPPDGDLRRGRMSEAGSKVEVYG